MRSQKLLLSRTGTSMRPTAVGVLDDMAELFTVRGPLGGLRVAQTKAAVSVVAATGAGTAVCIASSWLAGRRVPPAREGPMSEAAGGCKDRRCPQFSRPVFAALAAD